MATLEKQQGRVLIKADTHGEIVSVLTQVKTVLRHFLGDTLDPGNVHQATQGVSMSWHPEQAVQGFFVNYDATWSGDRLESLVQQLQGTV